MPIADPGAESAPTIRQLFLSATFTPPTPSSTASSSSSPLALSNLLPAGIVTLHVLSDALQTVCDHVHADDGWHTLTDALFLGRLATLEDAELCKELEFLVRHKFIVATYHATSDTEIYVRIYIIPYDLGNVQGKMRLRKENILSPARRYMMNLLPRISRDVDTWNGKISTSAGTALLPDFKDRRTLSEIYGDLASPNPVPTPGWEDITGRILDFNDNLDGLGMRSKLYKYQRRSVAAMMQNELDKRDITVPLYISLECIDGRKMYLQPGTMEILQERPMFAPSRGGILCEELGTGKTVMILALILATISQLPEPEESIIDDRPIHTPLSFRHFPSLECNAARQQLLRGKPNPYHSSPESRVPSLVELLLHRSSTAPDTSIPNLSTALGKHRYEKRLAIEENIENVPVGDLCRANIPFYLHYPGEPVNLQRENARTYKPPGPKVMYLSPATLVIVPPNLLSQWDREIIKHCEYPLRVLIIRAKTIIPSVRSLASDYDIILMTYPRYTAEASASDVSKLHSWKACTCDSVPGSRVPNCKCEIPEVSPFLQIRWKRLVIDEGHVSATLSTVLTPFTKLLSVERRWIVTGTPTTNLLGLGLGKKTSEDIPSAVRSSSADEQLHPAQGEDVLMEDVTSNPATPARLEQASSPNSSRSSSCTPSRESFQPRVWNKYDRGDLNKLGNMITHFVAVPQFTADSRLIHSHVIIPLLDRKGPRPGAIQVLKQVMEMVMIRHRIEDVEKDVVLPPVTQESVLLDLHPLVIKSYNALQASIAINAIDSQRTDQDYMFHPRNAEFLQITVKNISQIMFWSVENGLYNVDAQLEDSKKYFERAEQHKVSPEDMILLRDALRHIRLAAEDSFWRATQTHEDVLYEVHDISQRVYEAWTRMPLSGSSSYHSFTKLLHADRLLKLHDMVVAKPLMQEDAMIEEGARVAEDDVTHRLLYEQSLKKRKGNSSRRASRGQEDQSPSKLKSSSEAVKEMQKELDSSIARLEMLENEEEPEHRTSAPDSLEGVSVLVASSLLAKVRIGSSASSKLNYIINEVQQYSSKEKFLIFSESELSLAHVANALELINVKFLRFTAQHEVKVREQLVLTFETSEKYRVFLMELKHGARGLNLISASRIIFCEPVWQADVESQAIKRAHRIGQTRPISVKTLAIRRTVEENMAMRRDALKESQEKIPKLIAEVGMRHYIANPKFIESPPTTIPSVSFPLVHVPPPESIQPWSSGLAPQTTPSLLCSPPKKRVKFEDPILDVSSDRENQLLDPETPVKRVVRFA